MDLSKLSDFIQHNWLLNNIRLQLLQNKGGRFVYKISTKQENRKGISGGKVTVGFLTYILPCSDHRISHVETWAAQRLITLRYCMNSPNMSCKDFTDDKLGALLDRYSDDDKWAKFEHAHNQNRGFKADSAENP